MFVIKKAGYDDRYIMVQKNMPIVVTDINKATCFSKTEAEKYLLTRVRKNTRKEFEIVECAVDKNATQRKENSVSDAIKADTIEELKTVKHSVDQIFSTKRNKLSENLKYYDDVILDIRHYIRDEETKLNACQAAKVLYKLQTIERKRSEIKKELQRVDGILRGFGCLVKDTENFAYDKYKPRVVQNIKEYLLVNR